jgi:hypothetical protein
MAGGAAGGAVHPVNALGHGIVRGSIVGREVVHKAHHAVGGGAALAAGNGNLGAKAATRQSTWASRNAVFAKGQRRKTLRFSSNSGRMNHQKHQLATSRDLQGRTAIYRLKYTLAAPGAEGSHWFTRPTSAEEGSQGTIHSRGKAQQQGNFRPAGRLNGSQGWRGPLWRGWTGSPSARGGTCQAVKPGQGQSPKAMGDYTVMWKITCDVSFGAWAGGPTGLNSAARTAGPGLFDASPGSSPGWQPTGAGVPWHPNARSADPVTGIPASDPRALASEPRSVAPGFANAVRPVAGLRPVPLADQTANPLEH